MKSPRRLFVAASALLCLSTALSEAQIISYSFEGVTPWVSTGSSTATLSPVNGASLVSGGPNGTGNSLSVSHSGTPTSGSPAYASATGVTGIGGLNSFTVASWINVSSLNDNTTVFRIASTLGGTGGLDFSLVGTPSAFNLLLGVNTTSSQSSTTTASANGSWLFIAATYTSTGALGNGTINFYTGSAASAVTQLGATRTIGSTSQGGGTVLETTGSTSSTLQLGATPITVNNRTPTALFDDVSIYGSVLTVNQLDDVRLTAVPEPSTTGILVAATGFLILLRRYRKSSAARA